MLTKDVDLLVVGAGPAGSSAACAAAEMGSSVLLVDMRQTIGLPVQCAEYVPAQIVGQVAVPERAIVQRVRTLCTRMPTGEVITTPATGYVLDRASFDKALAARACRAGAEIWIGARALTREQNEVMVRRGGVEVKVRSSLVIGADGPRSTVGRWIGQVNEAFVEARQVEVVLEEPRDYTSVIFCPEFPGGYGWLFPKGKTANVGVGVSRALGGDVRQALDHLLDLLGISVSRIIGRTGGLVPVGGTVDSIQEGHVLLVGDAAGHTHPITGAGVFSAVVSGELAGRAAGRFVRGGGLDALAEYPAEWSAFMGAMLAHALTKRETLDRSWSDDAMQLSTVLRETWIAFRAYGRRRSKKRR